MSITSRITSMEEHVTNAYNGLQGLGADLTGIDKNIDNIASVLDNIYDDLPKVTDEDTSITLDNTRVGRLATTLKGNTSQTGTPTPSSPIPVNVVSGDNSIEICGKNLWGGINFSKTSATVNFTTNSDGTIVANGTATGGTAYSMTTNDATTGGYLKTLPAGTYKVSGGKSSTKRIRLTDANGTTIVTTQSSSTFTLENTTRLFVMVIISENETASNETFYPMVSATSTTFEPYNGDTYNIDLPEGMELCKIGNYQDYIYKDNGNWYKYGMVGKGVLNGSETWYRGLTNTTDYYRFFVDFGTNIQSGGASLKANVYSNKFIGITRDQSYGRNQGIAPTDTNYTYKSLIIYCEDTAQMTIADFKTWLSNNPTTVYYVYATPTNTEITYQPLIDQLNLLEKAISKEGQTNISQVNNDLPFIISASALKEWQESTSLNSTLSMVNPLSLGNTLNTQENNTQPIEVDNIEPLEEEENE